MSVALCFTSAEVMCLWKGAWQPVQLVLQFESWDQRRWARVLDAAMSANVSRGLSSLSSSVSEVMLDLLA